VAALVVLVARGLGTPTEKEAVSAGLWGTRQSSVVTHGLGVLRIRYGRRRRRRPAVALGGWILLVIFLG
jgi:hypothetical protein